MSSDYICFGSKDLNRQSCEHCKRTYPFFYDEKIDEKFDYWRQSYAGRTWMFRGQIMTWLCSKCEMTTTRRSIRGSKDTYIVSSNEGDVGGAEFRHSKFGEMMVYDNPNLNKDLLT
jgi:hypothetical protein